MAADMNLLTTEFNAVAMKLVDNCLKKGINMIPYETLRSPFVQAKYWRQSRNITEIDSAISTFKKEGASFLAYCLEYVGPQRGPKVTNALPGFSWHQWGEALDCYWELNGKTIWDPVTTFNGVNGYEVYATEAKKLHLDAGLFWKTLKDPPHVQYQKYGSPSEIYSLQEINDTMHETYSFLIK
jgi:peptidoglycan L-alanyl-D-glutamate endopeptidase CwlK